MSNPHTLHRLEQNIAVCHELGLSTHFKKKSEDFALWNLPHPLQCKSHNRNTEQAGSWKGVPSSLSWTETPSIRSGSSKPRSTRPWALLGMRHLPLSWTSCSSAWQHFWWRNILMPERNLPWCDLRPFSPVLLPVTWQNRLNPTSLKPLSGSCRGAMLFGWTLCWQSNIPVHKCIMRVSVEHLLCSCQFPQSPSAPWPFKAWAQP